MTDKTEILIFAFGYMILAQNASTLLFTTYGFYIFSAIFFVIYFLKK